MGSPNFSHDSILNTTFGYEPSDDDESWDQDSIMDSVLMQLETIKTNLFKPVISIGYHAGFVIHTEGVNGSYQMGTDDKDYMLDNMHDLIKRQLNDHDLLQGFIDGTADAVIREHADNDADYVTKSTEFLYILEVLNNAAEIYEQFEWILDWHMQPLVDALEAAGIKISGASDVEALYCDIDEVLDPKLIREAVSDCIEADINRLEKEITEIAKDYGLQKLVGKTWTSYLVNVDYNELES